MPGDRFLELAMAQDRHVLDVLFGDAPEAVTVQDRSGDLVYANNRAAEILGFATGAEMANAPVSDLVGRFEMVDETGQPIDVDILPGRRVLNGLIANEMTVGYRLKGSGKIRWSRVNASPIKNDAGEVVWALNFFLDISEHVRQLEVEKILQRVTTILSGTHLALGPDFSALAEILVPELASWCGFRALNDSDRLVPAAFASSEGDEAAELFDIGDPSGIDISSERIQAQVLATGRRAYISEIKEELANRAEDRFGPRIVELVERLQLRSIVCVPLGPPGAALGTMTLVRTESEPPFDSDDLALIDAIADRVGLALNNSRAYLREHETAEALRRGLVPSSLPEIPGLEIAARYEPLARLGQVGGDFFDFVVVDDRRCGIVVGDIEGKGVAAAAAVAVARSALRTAILLEPNPSVVLGQLNQTMLTEQEPRMCTVAYLLLDRYDDRFSATVSLAGHPPPLLYRADGSVALLGIPCPPAGVLETLNPQPVTLDLYPGDVLVLYTDGISRRELPPPETVMSLGPCRSDEHLQVYVDRALDQFRSVVPTVRDDVILIAIRIVGSEPEPEAEDEKFESRSEQVSSRSMASVSK
ncbi:MAG TPA: SpoIIE family protein phosphatase [Acidimicrobiia bacterium]|nr:SpoIIE family protein phosphatase [Acidimicrobiia bacterium]